MAHARRTALAIGLLACGVAVVAAVVLGTPAHNVRHKAHGTGHENAAGAGTSAAAVQAGARHLNEIVQLFIAGKHLSHNQHDYRAAVQERMGILHQLKAFRAPWPLRPAVTTLTQMTTDSLSFNQDMLRGQTALARAPNNAHNALRGRFVAQFNPYARRYLGVSYTINDL